MADGGNLKRVQCLKLTPLQKNSSTERINFALVFDRTGIEVCPLPRLNGAFVKRILNCAHEGLAVLPKRRLHLFTPTRTIDRIKYPPKVLLQSVPFAHHNRLYLPKFQRAEGPVSLDRSSSMAGIRVNTTHAGNLEEAHNGAA